MNIIHKILGARKRPAQTSKLHPYERATTPPPPPRVVFFTISPSAAAAATVTHGAHPVDSDYAQVPPFFRAPTQSPTPVLVFDADLTDIDYNSHNLAPPAAALAPTPSDNGADNFKHTILLINATLQAILDDPDSYIIRNMVAVFLRTCDSLLVGKGHADFLNKLQDVKDIVRTMRRDVLLYLRQPSGIPLCISTELEQLIGEGVIWGITNQKEDREDFLGFMIPAMNWALCEAYEQTVLSYPSLASVG
ncbi:hypothetical protein B0H17DRAFT_459869 [Mycena rosella]|uniref:Uncharacterized protein n=1 Tax=Mycena rosella TaxID=1033263 RepID=A0AAD7C9S1_MYCRO|nr:hypothetical protein B0H17DRAFT_459869 [Mycena rosella]